jgi:hypothetical protein
MATYNFTDGSITNQPKCTDTLPNTAGPFVRSNIIDFANQNLDSGNNDIANVLNVPADTWVTEVMVRVLTAETANAEMYLGSGLDYNQWCDNVAVTATGNLAVTKANEYFAAADTIDITNNNNDVDYDALKLEIVAVMVPGNKADSDGLSNQST